MLPNDETVGGIERCKAVLFLIFPAGNDFSKKENTLDRGKK